MTVDVVIPAWNEERTIGEIILAFRKHPAVGNVWVGIDFRTSDLTAVVAMHAGGITISRDQMGKGQVVRALLREVTTPTVIFSDADYLVPPSQNTVQRLVDTDYREMTVAVPRTPSPAEWAVSRFPRMFDARAWAMMSGLRCAPMWMVRQLELYGFLMETQINQEAEKENIVVSYIRAPEIRAPLRFTEQRMSALHADRQYGISRGILRGDG